MKTTTDLLEAYLKDNYQSLQTVEVQGYSLNGSIIKINYRLKRSDPSALDIKYNNLYSYDSIDVEVLEYITFVFNLK